MEMQEEIVTVQEEKPLLSILFFYMKKDLGPNYKQTAQGSKSQ